MTITISPPKILQDILSPVHTLAIAAGISPPYHHLITTRQELPVVIVTGDNHCTATAYMRRQANDMISISLEVIAI